MGSRLRKKTKNQRKARSKKSPGVSRWQQAVLVEDVGRAGQVAGGAAWKVVVVVRPKSAASA